MNSAQVFGIDITDWIIVAFTGLLVALNGLLVYFNRRLHCSRRFQRNARWR